MNDYRGGVWVRLQLLIETIGSRQFVAVSSGDLSASAIGEIECDFMRAHFRYVYGADYSTVNQISLPQFLHFSSSNERLMNLLMRTFADSCPTERSYSIRFV